MSAVRDEATQARHAAVEAVEATEDAARAHEAAKPRPDAVVKEPEIRRAVGRLVEGLAKQAHGVGMLPRAELARQWAEPIVLETVKRHEDTFGKQQEPLEVKAAPSALDRGDVGGTVINRRVGVVEMGAPGAGLSHVSGMAPRPAKPIDHLLKERTDMLLSLPDWAAKIHKAFEGGMLKYGEQSRACDDVMAVIESSNNVFGDWRTPRRAAPRIIIGG